MPPIIKAVRRLAARMAEPELPQGDDGSAPPSYSADAPDDEAIAKSRSWLQATLANFTVYHVYKRTSLTMKDDVVTGADKKDVLYFLDFPYKVLYKSWDLSLRRGGRDGPLVCQIVKGGRLENSFKFVWPERGLTTPVKRHGPMHIHYGMRYEFRDENTGEWYVWKQDGFLRALYDWSLFKKSEIDADIPKEERTLVAHWRTPTYTLTKDGTLHVNPAFRPLSELFLATALGVEERSQEKRDH